MNLTELPRIWRTVHHLRWSQIAKRVERTAFRRLRRVVPKGWQLESGRMPDEASVLSLLSAHEFPATPYRHAAESDDAEFIAMLRRGDFRHLHQTERVGRNRPDWRLGNPSQSRLWTITLHYHAWAYRLASIIDSHTTFAAEAEELLEFYLGDWLSRCDRNAPGSEDLAWNSYTIATRIPAWIRSFVMLQDSFFAKRPTLRSLFLQSLWEQARYLAGHLEWDLRANHLLRDAVGLAWASRFFVGNESRRWLDIATKLAGEQLREQVLADGGHFERSPHYHAEAMQDFLALSLLIDDQEIAAEIRSRWEGMAEYLAWMRHPDGLCPQLNDSPAFSPDELLNAGEIIGIVADLSPRKGFRHFSETGNVAWHDALWTVFFDVGEIGPSYQPGHAHADSLSVECSLDGQRLFVDPGCYGYDHDDDRRYDRSTESHNTLCIDETDSSEVWHIFRVGRRARPLNVSTEHTLTTFDVHASNDGFDHLPGRPRHSRTVRLIDSGVLEIIDVVDGTGPHVVRGGYLLSPQWNVETSENSWKLRQGSGRANVKIEANHPLSIATQSRPLHSDYGRREETRRLCWSYQGPLPLKVITRISRDQIV